MFFTDLTQKFINIIQRGAATKMTDKQFLEMEIGRWLFSPKRLLQLDGERYYNGDHDILGRKRTAVGENGELMEVTHLPNKRIVDNQYLNMVDQKVNYLLSQPLTFESSNDTYDKLLKTVFNRQFMKQLKNTGIDALNGGITWVHPYFDEAGQFRFKRFPSYQVLPFWRDEEHTDLDCAIRLYQIEGYEGTTPVIIDKVEVYGKEGVERYEYKNGALYLDNDFASSSYLTVDGKPYSWERIPLVAFKYNAKEIPLIKRIKSLQDVINELESDFANRMQEDTWNTILVLSNYGGTDLGEFRRNLALYGVVKVTTVDGAQGDLKALNVEVNSGNYEAVLKLLKKALIENAKGYDAKDDRLGGNANIVNIKSMYSDIDLDANNMESEYQASMEQLLWFVNTYLANSGQGNYTGTPVTITFNRDMLMNETELLQSLSTLGLKLSNETLVGQVPFINDVANELQRIDEEKQANMDIYGAAFGAAGNDTNNVIPNNQE